MLRLTTYLLAVLVAVDAFSVRPISFRQQRCAALASPDFATAMPEVTSPYEKLGIEEANLALGVDPEEVLTYIGTRKDLIKMTMSDITSFDRLKAEAEVDKFLMDKEMVGLLIQFRKAKEENPDFKVPKQEDGEGFFSLRTVVIGYLGYVAYTTVPELIRDWVAEKEAAGEWSGTNIPLIDDWLANSATKTVEVLSDSVQSAGL